MLIGCLYVSEFSMGIYFVTHSSLSLWYIFYFTTTLTEAYKYSVSHKDDGLFIDFGALVIRSIDAVFFIELK